MFRPLLRTVLLALIGSAALAETPLPPEFVACSRIPKNGERLACYDRAVAYFTQPAEQQAAAPTPEASFGLQGNAPQAPVDTQEPERESDEISSITARITEIGSDREKKKIVTLDNGQTWRELSSPGYVSLKIGDQVTINRAALGSFMMSTPNGRPLRVRRIK